MPNGIEMSNRATSRDWTTWPLTHADPLKETGESSGISRFWDDQSFDHFHKWYTKRTFVIERQVNMHHLLDMGLFPVFVNCGWTLEWNPPTEAFGKIFSSVLCYLSFRSLLPSWDKGALVVCISYVTLFWWTGCRFVIFHWWLIP